MICNNYLCNNHFARPLGLTCPSSQLKWTNPPLQPSKPREFKKIAEIWAVGTQGDANFNPQFPLSGVGAGLGFTRTVPKHIGLTRAELVPALDPAPHPASCPSLGNTGSAAQRAVFQPCRLLTRTPLRAWGWSEAGGQRCTLLDTIPEPEVGS